MKYIKFLILGFLMVFISFSSFTIYTKYFNNSILESEILSHLESIAQSKSNRISSFLDERKNDLVYLSSEPDIISLYSTNGSSLNQDLIDKLSFYKNTNQYLDLVLIDIDGKILWSASNDLDIGVNLNSEIFNDSKFGDIYHKVKKDFGVGIYDSGYYKDESFSSLFVTSPILVDSKIIENKKDMIGIIALQIDNTQIESRIVNQNSEDNLIDTYLVNREGTTVTTVVSNGNSVTNINTQMYSDCFSSYANYYQKQGGAKFTPVDKSGIYENYLGNYVFGAHQYILQTELCVMVEIDKNKYYNKEPIQKQLFFTFFILTIICILVIYTIIKYFNISGGSKKSN
jgi:hypothetical protein